MVSEYHHLTPKNYFRNLVHCFLVFLDCFNLTCKSLIEAGPKGLKLDRPALGSILGEFGFPENLEYRFSQSSVRVRPSYFVDP